MQGQEGRKRKRGSGGKGLTTSDLPFPKIGSQMHSWTKFATRAATGWIW